MEPPAAVQRTQCPLVQQLISRAETIAGFQIIDRKRCAEGNSPAQLVIVPALQQVRVEKRLCMGLQKKGRIEIIVLIVEVEIAAFSSGAVIGGRKRGYFDLNYQNDYLYP